MTNHAKAVAPGYQAALEEKYVPLTQEYLDQRAIDEATPIQKTLLENLNEKFESGLQAIGAAIPANDRGDFYMLEAAVGKAFLRGDYDAIKSLLERPQGLPPEAEAIRNEMVAAVEQMIGG